MPYEHDTGTVQQLCVRATQRKSNRANGANSRRLMTN